MLERISMYPGRVELTPVAGMTNTYDMVRADQPVKEGTPLNKATFLKDSTAALFGLDSDAVPDDVFRTIDARLRLLSGRTNFVSGTYTGAGTYGANNANTLTFDGIVHMVIISGITDAANTPTNPIIAMKGAAESYSDAHTITMNWTSNSFTWYSTSAAYQANTADVVYTYMALVENPNYSGVATIYAQTQDGTPLVGASVYNLWDEQANTGLLTDSEGKVSGYATSGSEITITPKEVDLVKTKAAIGAMTNGAITQTVVVSPVSDGTIVEITESKTVQFSNATASVDVCCVGGGGGGGIGFNTTSSSSGTKYAGGGGGGGGTITNSSGLAVTAWTDYVAEIGAGGAKASGSAITSSSSEVVGSAGGTTSFLGVSAIGGGGGNGYYGTGSTSSLRTGTGGTSTNGGAGGAASASATSAAGQDSTEYPFGDAAMRVSGGGGGATTDDTVAAGGAAYGASGARIDYSAPTATIPAGPGGGGGGGGHVKGSSISALQGASNGADGIVYVKIHRG